MASSISSCSTRCAFRLSRSSTMADSSMGVYILPPRLYSFAVPMKHLKEATVSSGWVSSRSFATAPTRKPSPSTYPTALGNSTFPSSPGISSSLPSLQ